MTNIFNPDSKIMCALSRVADLILLNLLMLVCSIPILTIGVSITALFASIRDIVNGNDSRIVSAYFRHWKKDIRKATILITPILLLFGLILLDIILLYQQEPVAVLDIGILLMAVIAFIGFYLGSLQMFVCFDDPIRRTWINGIKLFIARFPHMLLGIVLLMIPWITLMLSPTKFFQLFIVFILIGVSGPIYVLQLLLRPVIETISNKNGSTRQ